jgi:predicted small secreted protein
MTRSLSLTTALTVAFLGCLPLMACSNTFGGAGKDIENAGEAVQDAAN